METVYFNETACHTNGNIPVAGDKAPDFTLTTQDLDIIKLSDYAGKRLVLNVFPSLDTPVCAMSVRKFNKEAASLDNTAVVCVSVDLPFAAKRFCTAEGIENLTVGSAFRSPDFLEGYGLQMVDGPLKGLLARAVIVVDTDGTVRYSQLVENITDEPDYKAAISVLKEYAVNAN